MCKVDELLLFAPRDGRVLHFNPDVVLTDAGLFGRLKIRIGDRSNVQDLTIIHVMRDAHPTLIGHDVSIGHGAVIHGCTIEDRCLIGMGAILLNGVVVGTGSIVAAGALVPEGMVIPPGSMVMGMPARVKRTLSADEQASIQWYADNYVRYRLDFQDASSS